MEWKKNRTSHRWHSCRKSNYSTSCVNLRFLLLLDLIASRQICLREIVVKLFININIEVASACEKNDNLIIEIMM